MKLSERWLRTLSNPPIDSAALCEALTMAGLEVEESCAATPPASGVVVARIEAVAPHPDADRLRICTVDAGEPQRLTIVCGAANASAGMTVACAKAGAVLPGGLVIRRADVHGVASEGMLCSAKELGIGDDASGLMELSAELTPGSGVREALALDDTLITLKLTPNRADCLSILGIAREVSAVTGAALVRPAIAPIRVDSVATHRVRIEDAAACPRFASRVIEGVNPNAPTPAWMKVRLERCGMRSISAIVDITNYVMLELGQPLHAYDRSRVEGDLVVRFARPGEKLLLLNGDTLDLQQDLLLVCDEVKPLGLAGIMGGQYSGIDSATTNLLLEGAFWNPAVIQGRMRRLGFASDAGFRFERGVDFELPPQGVERATELVLSICGGRAGPLSDARSALPSRDPVRVRPARVRKLLGIELSAADIAEVFRRLDIPAIRDGDDFIVTPPSYRFDLAIEEDLVEEVARIRGYDAIPATNAAHPATMLPLPETRRATSSIRAQLVANGWQEIVTFGFVSSRVEAALDPSGVAIRVLNPIAAQFDVMRRSLLPGLIETLRTNLNRRADRVRVFEVGRVFREARAAPEAQPLRVGGLAYGAALPEQWGAPSRPVDLFDVKGDLEALAVPCRLTSERVEHPSLHPGRSAGLRIDGVDAGWLGELHPRLVRHFELPRSAVVFEIDLERLLVRAMPAVRTVSRQPVVRRDVAIVVDEAVGAQAVIEALEGASPPEVDAVRVFDQFRGAGIPPGRKSLAILVLMQDTARTLTDAEIDAVVAGLVSMLGRRFGATLRT